jgi:hypothetical protein
MKASLLALFVLLHLAAALVGEKPSLAARNAAAQRIHAAAHGADAKLPLRVSFAGPRP